MIFARRYTLSLLFLMLAVIGLLSWSRLPVELTPDISLPSVTVSYNWGSTAPEVMEMNITRRVESIAYRLRDVTQVRSTTSEGISRVVIEFTKKAPVDFRVIELQEALYTLYDDLPRGVSQHSINRAVPRELSDVPQFMTWSLNGMMEPAEMRRIAETRIQMPLLGTSGLADIQITGVPEPALLIHFDALALERYNMRAPAILAMVSAQLSWRSTGYSERPGGRYELVIPPSISDVGDIENLPISLPNSDRTIRLGQLATVERGTVPERSVTRINGNRALTITMIKEPGADALILAESIREEMEAIRAELPYGLELRLERDATETIRKQLGELQVQAGWSIIVILVLLLVLLRQVKAPIVILGSIAGSLFLSGIALLLMGYTLNLLTLAGLAVSLGMIIDNAVVVYERIHPGLPKDRMARVDHVRRLLPDAVVPVIGATLTTVAIFIPVMFAMERLRDFLEPLAVALTSSLISSVIVSLVFIPYALIWIFGNKKAPKGWDVPRLRFTRHFFTLRHKMRYVLALLFLGSAGYVGYTSYKNVHFGDPWRMNTGETIQIWLRAPQGSPLEEIDKIALNFETVIHPFMPWIEYYQTDLSEYGNSTIRITLIEGAAFIPEPYRLMGELMYLAARTGNIGTSVYGLEESFNTGFGGGFSSQRLTLIGYGYQELANVAEDLKIRLERSRRVSNVNTNAHSWMREDFKQFILRLDAAKLTRLGINRMQLIDAMSLDLSPDNSYGDVEMDGERLRLIGKNDVLRQYWVDFRDQARVQNDAFFTVGEIASLTRESGMGQIVRRDQAYERMVSYDFLGPSQMAQDVQKAIKETFPLPIGIRFQDDNRFRFEDSETRKNTIWVLLMALLSVWMVVAALLNRFRASIYVLTAVMYALLGILCGVLYHGMSVGQGAIAGALLTVGVVVNNAILLYYGRETLRSQGINRMRAWKQVYRNHTRTVLITSLTTMGGLVPLLLWGTELFWTQLSTVVVWGLGFSTVLVLLFTGMWEKPGPPNRLSHTSDTIPEPNDRTWRRHFRLSGWLSRGR